MADLAHLDLHRWSVRRVALFTFGWVCVSLGTVGVFLPVLPTVPFLILAVWAFARSSQRWHDWIYESRRFGPMIRDWDEHRVIPPKGKFLSLFFMSASFVYVAGFSDAPLIGVIAMGLTLAAVGLWIATRPSRPGTRPPPTE